MRQQLVRVEGNDGLYKDSKTGVVVNMDSQSLDICKKAREKILNQRKKEKELEERINKLEKAVNAFINQHKK